MGNLVEVARLFYICGRNDATRLFGKVQQPFLELDENGMIFRSGSVSDGVEETVAYASGS